ncbi:Cytochrome c6 [uncultured archaeon]|nr:Cytochrome c6 [uncultured archaeon]
MSSLSSLSSAQIQAIANVLPSSPTPTPTPTSTVTPDGAALYAGNCAGCHNPLATTTKPGRTAAQIQNAIATVSAMSSLSSLSSAQIQAIATALAVSSTPTPTPTSTVTPDGTALYASYCQGCHGPLATTTKPGRTATQIQNAIATVSAMSSLSSLSSAQINAIATALAVSTPTPSPTSNTQAQNYALYCAGCHGANQQGGSGPAITPTALASLGFTTTQIDTIVTNGLGSMPAFVGSMSASAILALSQWLLPAGTPTPTLDGTSLYGSLCQSCHGPLATSSVGGASATQIQGAIRSVSRMNSLSSLSSAQIQAIANALAGIQPHGD